MAVYTLANFQNQLRITDYSFNLTENVAHSRTYGGEIYRASSGQRLWVGSISCSSGTYEGNRKIEALVSTMQEAGNYFNFCPKIARKPIAPTTSDLSNVQVAIAPISGKSIRLKNLPNEWHLSAGDYLSFASNGVNLMYQVAANAEVTNGQAIVSLTHSLIPGFLPAVNDAVRLVDPIVTCQIKPGSVSFGRVGLAHTSGISFDFFQSIRAT